MKDSVFNNDVMKTRCPHTKEYPEQNYHQVVQRTRCETQKIKTARRQQTVYSTIFGCRKGLSEQDYVCPEIKRTDK